MNKLKLALALGTGLTLGALAPAARASSIQALPTTDMQSSAFSSLFKASSPVQTSTVDFAGAPNAGTLSSQVFVGQKTATGDATGLYAYAYQVSLSNNTNASGEPVHVDGTSFQFNATPAASSLAGTGSEYAYLVTDGKVGGLAAPTTGASVPKLSWQTGSNIGSILATYADGSTSASPLSAGQTSATFVVLSTEPPSSNFQYAGVLSSSPQTGAPAVYSPKPTVSPAPIPEPATILAWAGMAGAFALARRARKARLA